MHRLLAVCLLVACCGPFGTSAVWLEGPPLKQPVPKAASAASEGFASPPESDHAAFVRPSASHEPWQVVGGEEGDEGGVTSQSAAGAHAEAELGGWRGVRGAFKAVSGLPELVAKLVEKGAQEELAAAQAEIDPMLESSLAEGWRLERVEQTLRAILRAGAYELTARTDVPTAVIINEYVNVAHAFFSGSEPGFVNGILDRLAGHLRADHRGGEPAGGAPRK